MNLKKTLLALVGTAVVAASAHAETPLFTTGSTVGVVGSQSDWTAVSFSALSSIGPAVVTYQLLPEQTAAAATQTFSVNGSVVFAGSATGGATATSGSAITVTSFAFDSNVGGLHSVSTTTGNTGLGHSGSYQIYESNTRPDTFALAYEDDYSANSSVHGDYNDMAVVVQLSVAAVPEPETYALMGGGLAALAFVSRRRRAV